MTHKTLCMSAIAAALAGTILALSGCAGRTDTPAQVMVGLRAAEGAALTLFNAYGSQRPFCGDPGAKVPPLCADRAAVIRGAAAADELDAALDQADLVIQSAGVSDTSWAALTKPKMLLEQFQKWVESVRKAP